jgi:dihydrofolate reductase
VPEIKLIAAIDSKQGIAKDGKIPWDLPSDRKYFRDKIKDGPIVMGWNTFTSNKFKPYGDGRNIVITHRKIEAAPGVWIVHDIKELFEKSKEDLWVIGGGQIFAEALPYATKLYITQVEGDFDCDVVFPDYKDSFKLHNQEPVLEENGTSFSYQIWVANK